VPTKLMIKMQRSQFSLTETVDALWVICLAFRSRHLS
jgi:hypothetical protein